MCNLFPRRCEEIDNLIDIVDGCRQVCFPHASQLGHQGRERRGMVLMSSSHDHLTDLDRVWPSILCQRERIAEYSSRPDP